MILFETTCRRFVGSRDSASAVLERRESWTGECRVLIVGKEVLDCWCCVGGALERVDTTSKAERLAEEVGKDGEAQCVLKRVNLRVCPYRSRQPI